MDHNHLLGIFSEDLMLQEGLSFLKQGWDNDETLLLITDCLSQEKLLAMMRSEWNVNNLKIGEQIIITSVKEWYFKTNGRLEPERIYRQWENIVNLAKNRGTKGVRVFADVRYFFDVSRHQELLDYEKTLPDSFDFPLCALCAYTDTLIEKIGRREFRDLRASHAKLVYKLNEKDSSSKTWFFVPNVIKKIILDTVNDAQKMDVFLLLMQGSMTANYIIRKLNLPKTSFYRKIDELIRDGLVTQRTHRGTTRYSANYTGMSISVENGSVDICASNNKFV